MSGTPERHLPLASLVAGVLVLAVTASAITIGADSFWLVAMGDHIVARGVPLGVPFAAADSSHWVNVSVLAEVISSTLQGLGPLGLTAAQLLADALALGLIILGSRTAGAGDVALTVVLTAAGTLRALGVVRAQSLSLVPFALLLLLLLQSEQEGPSRRIWRLGPVTKGVVASGR